jgi:hypothetical protein
MMKSLLSALFNGNLYPNERFIHTPEYKQINKSILQEMKFWETTLSGDDFKKLENLQGLFCKSGSIENEQHFSIGFKLGVLIMVEVFCKQEELFNRKE